MSTLKKINNLPKTVWVGEGIEITQSADKKTVTLSVQALVDRIEALENPV